MNPTLKAALHEVFEQSCAHAREYGGAIENFGICAMCKGERTFINMKSVMGLGDTLFHTHIYDEKDGLYGSIQPPSCEDIWASLFTTKPNYIVCKDVIWSLRSLMQNPPNDFKRVLLIYDMALGVKFFELCEAGKKSAAIQFIKQNFSSLNIDLCRFAGSRLVRSMVMKKYKISPEDFDLYYSLLLKGAGLNLFKICTF